MIRIWGQWECDILIVEKEYWKEDKNKKGKAVFTLRDHLGARSPV